MAALGPQNRSTRTSIPSKTTQQKTALIRTSSEQSQLSGDPLKSNQAFYARTTPQRPQPFPKCEITTQTHHVPEPRETPGPDFFASADEPAPTRARSFQELRTASQHLKRINTAQSRRATTDINTLTKTTKLHPHRNRAQNLKLTRISSTHTHVFRFP